MTLSLITSQGLFTELLSNVGKRIRNEVQPGKVKKPSLNATLGRQK